MCVCIVNIELTTYLHFSRSCTLNDHMVVGRRNDVVGPHAPSLPPVGSSYCAMQKHMHWSSSDTNRRSSEQCCGPSERSIESSLSAIDDQPIKQKTKISNRIHRFIHASLRCLQIDRSNASTEPTKEKSVRVSECVRVSVSVVR